MTAIALISGHEGRLGAAFARRLLENGYTVRIATDDSDIPEDAELYYFDCAYTHGEEKQHLERITPVLRQWRHYDGIFIPSSMWIGTDTSYGRVKLLVEQLAKFYNGLGANIITDRIGYFPGDDVEPDPSNPFFDKLVTGDALYARVMEMMIR